MIDVKIPSPGESITQVQLASWLVSNGQYVEKDDEIVEIDSDKASLSISAEESGKIQILAEEGDTLEVGAVVAKIDTDAKAPADSEKSESESKETSAKTDEEKAEKEEPKDVSERKTSDKKQTNKKAEKENITQASSESDQKPDVNIQVTPLAKQILKEKGIDVSKLGESIKNLKISKLKKQDNLRRPNRILKTLRRLQLKLKINLQYKTKAYGATSVMKSARK